MLAMTEVLRFCKVLLKMLFVRASTMKKERTA